MRRGNSIWLLSKLAECTHNGDASFAEVPILLLQGFALEFKRFELNFKNFILLLQRGQSVR